jgi:hypothetical protein
VRHRRGALLPLGKWFLDLADLGLLQSTDLESELFQGRTGDRNGRHQLGVAIALNHLRGYRRHIEAKPLTGIRFDRWWQVGKRSYGAGQLADGHHLARAAQPDQIARELGVPQCQLQSEGHRLGVHAVRATDHRGVSVFLGSCSHRLHQPIDVLHQEVTGLPHLNRLGGVDHVRGGEAEVQPARGRADMLGNGRRKGDDVVLGNLFDRFDSGDVEGALLADIARRFRRDDPRPGHRVDRGDFHLQPGFVFPLVAPDATHLGIRIPRNHVSRAKAAPSEAAGH